VTWLLQLGFPYQVSRCPTRALVKHQLQTVMRSLLELALIENELALFVHMKPSRGTTWRDVFKLLIPPEGHSIATGNANATRGELRIGAQVRLLRIPRSPIALTSARKASATSPSKAYHSASMDEDTGIEKDSPETQCNGPTGAMRNLARAQFRAGHSATPSVCRDNMPDVWHGRYPHPRKGASYTCESFCYALSAVFFRTSPAAATRKQPRHERR
jgi:hypothetical protein